MSYSGSTAAPPNPPINVYAGLGIGNGSSALTGNNKAKWMYSSTNLTTDITAPNFFTDAWSLGMRAGHMVEGTQYTSAGSSVVTFIGTMSAVTTAGGTLSTGGLITSTFT